MSINSDTSIVKKVYQKVSREFIDELCNNIDMQKMVKLPASVKARIFKGSSKKWIVELPKYDMVAQVDSEAEIDNMVTSLVFTHFRVSDKFKSKIRYVPKDPSPNINKTKTETLPFQKFVAPNFIPSV